MTAGATIDSIGEKILCWYDSHARELPWRVGPAERQAGQAPDPYHVWLSEIMLQQTTVAAVIAPYNKFVKRWPTVSALASAPEEEVMAAWAGLGYYSRARNLLRCARILVNEFRGRFPRQPGELQKLPGIGSYTASAIAAIAFDYPTVAMDGNAERVMARLGAVTIPPRHAKRRLRELAIGHAPSNRSGDYAQAVMDLGATICRPGAPLCTDCPCRCSCQAFASGMQSQLPVREARPQRPTRRGIAYIGRNRTGAWMMERRSPQGLLGGMLGWPGSEWGSEFKELPPCEADWTPVAGEVRHVFTHFTLLLRLMTAENLPLLPPPDYLFVAPQEFDPSVLPSLMRKAFDHAAHSFAS